MFASRSVYLHILRTESLLGNVLISVAAKIGVKGHFSLSVVLPRHDFMYPRCVVRELNCSMTRHL
jgi:hypothetical protein